MKILIIGAMEAEIALLKTFFAPLEKNQLKDLQLFQARHSQHELYFAEIGIGKVNAAYATAKILHFLAPDLVMNVGTSGNLSAQLKLGDVVVATSSTYWDVDVSAFNYAIGQVPKMPATYPMHTKWVALAKTTKLMADIQIASGPIVSGDSFIAEAETKQRIQMLFPYALAVDMESTAIAQVCHLENTPLCIIRSITDSSSDGAALSHEAFLKISSENAGRVVNTLLASELESFLPFKSIQ